MAKGRMLLNENRGQARSELIYYLKLTERETGRELGRLGDIHTEGMLVFTPDPLPDQAVYDLLLELLKAMAKEGFSELPVRAQVLWSNPGPKLSNYYNNGLRFQDQPMPAQSQKVIDRLIEIFAMPDKG